MGSLDPGYIACYLISSKTANLTAMPPNRPFEHNPPCMPSILRREKSQSKDRDARVLRQKRSRSRTWLDLAGHKQGWATTHSRAAVNHSPVGSFSSRSSVHAHTHTGPTSPESTRPKHNLFRHFLSPSQNSTLACRARRCGLRSGCGQQV